MAREMGIAVTGLMHPNKRGSTFRELVAGSSAFNAVSRSSLLLAAHPEDEDRRCLVRGKGNLSAPPAAVEFAIESCRFEANSHSFNVPKATGFVVGDIRIDELIESKGGERAAEHSKVAEAGEIIEALLPRDGNWHPAGPIYEACDANEIERRTVQRAMKRLVLDHRRAATFQAPSEWRWPDTQARPHATGDKDVASVACGVSGGSKTPLNTTHDTHDTDDTHNASRVCVTSGDRDALDTLAAPHRAETSDEAPAEPITRLRLAARNPDCTCVDGGIGDAARCERCYGFRPAEIGTAAPHSMQGHTAQSLVEAVAAGRMGDEEAETILAQIEAVA